MENNSLGSIKLEKLERIIESIKNYYKDTPKRFEDIEISAEFLIPSCFPQLYKNFQNNIKDQYTKGYMQGLKEGKGENEAKISE